MIYLIKEAFKSKTKLILVFYINIINLIYLFLKLLEGLMKHLLKLKCSNSSLKFN